MKSSPAITVSRRRPRRRRRRGDELGGRGPVQGLAGAASDAAVRALTSPPAHRFQIGGSP